MVGSSPHSRDSCSARAASWSLRVDKMFTERATQQTKKILITSRTDIKRLHLFSTYFINRFYHYSVGTFNMPASYQYKVWEIEANINWSWWPAKAVLVRNYLEVYWP